MKGHRNQTKIVWRSRLGNNIQRCLDEYMRESSKLKEKLKRQINQTLKQAHHIRRRPQSAKNVTKVKRAQFKCQRDELYINNERYLLVRTESDHQDRTNSVHIAKSNSGMINKQRYQRQSSIKKQSNKQGQASNQQKRNNYQQRINKQILQLEQARISIATIKENMKSQPKVYTFSNASYKHIPSRKQFLKSQGQKKFEKLRNKMKASQQELNFLRQKITKTQSISQAKITEMHFSEQNKYQICCIHFDTV